MSTVIKVENLSKQYRLGQIGTGTISHDLNRWWSRVRGKEDPFLKIGESNDRTQKGNSDYVWSLRDINFEVKQGDVLGIIGRNGAGKSTLLKILSKTTAPTTGSIKVKGRIASLLEVGTGFHPELSGRDNIFLNGAILGMSKKEIKSKFDEIVDFSGVERYIDTPVKRYSSGMYVRLAFAVAAHLEPEILIVDEVLAVGDAEFQQKCIGKMKDVSVNDGRTVLFVSHNMGAISQLCNSGLFLKNGCLINQGSIGDIVNNYLDTASFKRSEISFDRLITNTRGQLLNAKIMNSFLKGCTEFAVGSVPKLEIEYELFEKVKNFHIAVILTDSLGNHIYSTADTDTQPNLLKERGAGVYKVRLELPTYNLNTGNYNVGIGMGIINSEIFHRVDAFSFSILDIGDFGTGKENGRRKGLLLIENEWKYL